MSIQSAMYSGVSGLNTNSQAMSVIGNNLANTNTIGFKGGRTVFSDLLSSNVTGSGGSSQIGRGVGLSSVDNIFSQGTFETTASGTDVAIEGPGFFVLREPGSDIAYYSRAGAFRFDEDGFLINPEDLRVQGKQFDFLNNDELLPAEPKDIQVANVGLLEASATTELSFNSNLDAKSVELGGGAGDIDPADRATYSYSAAAPIFDSLGQSHLVSVYWRLVDNATNTWASGYTIDNDPATYQEIPELLVFDNKGNRVDANGDGFPDDFTVPIILPDPADPGANWPNGAAPQVIDLNFDTTQYDSNSTVLGHNQNGYSAGDLINVAINNEGIVVASYSNGRQINMAQLVMAKFQNTGGLQLAGANRYIAPAEVGAIRIGLPGPELGKISTNSLEQSNVDMGQEFVKMITTQRGFQANSKIITTVDEMLGELINLKR